MQEPRLHGGDAAGCSWPSDATPSNNQPSEENAARAAPAVTSGQQWDAREPGTAERDHLRSSRQPFPEQGGREHGTGLPQPAAVLKAPTLSGRIRPASRPWNNCWRTPDDAPDGGPEEGGPTGALELEPQNPMTLRFKDPDLERRFRTRHAEASGPADSWGDRFLLLLCLLALLVRARSACERAVPVALALSCFGKMLLRARARAAYQRHRAAIVSAQRVAMMLSSCILGRIQLARPRVYAISGSLASLCGALFINTRLVTFTLSPVIMPLPWAEDLLTTLGGVGMILFLLAPKFCTPEHLSHQATAAAMQYLASAVDELCGGTLPLEERRPGQGQAQAQCLQLHLFAQVFWGCLVPLTAAYILESRQRQAFAHQCSPMVVLDPNRDPSTGLHGGPLGADLCAPSSIVQNSHNERRRADLATGHPSDAPSCRPAAEGTSETSGDISCSSDAENQSPIAADLLVAAAVLPVVGAALWQLLRVCIG